MDIDGNFHVRSNGLADKRAHREVWHVVVVHDIEVNEARTSGLHGLDLFPESGEVSREDARRNAVR